MTVFIVIIREVSLGMCQKNGLMNLLNILDFMLVFAGYCVRLEQKQSYSSTHSIGFKHCFFLSGLTKIIHKSLLLSIFFLLPTVCSTDHPSTAYRFCGMFRMGDKEKYIARVEVRAKSNWIFETLVNWVWRLHFILKPFYLFYFLLFVVTVSF